MESPGGEILLLASVRFSRKLVLVQSDVETVIVYGTANPFAFSSHPSCLLDSFRLDEIIRRNLILLVVKLLIR